MKITNISQRALNDYEINALLDMKTIKKDKIEPAKPEIQPNKIPWQKDILMSAITSLENNKQLDNNHPLGKLSNAPIESFEEAKIELNYFKTPFYKNSASQAQANLSIQDVLYLFTND
jgi:hypothetical protein